jgi:hypothetical protein
MPEDAFSREHRPATNQVIYFYISINVVSNKRFGLVGKYQREFEKNTESSHGSLESHYK